MSVVQRMEIRGIRSYSPNISVQMQFPVPVTLILGHNGSGKTTIIECLKFACSGETPTGNKGSFVHAPKLADETEIRGQVRLQFIDTAGKKACVSRTLVTTQKQKTQTTRTLDGTIKRMTKDGQAETISKKCIDLDKEMIRCLGVSKSVLNNVIFCHQEDSLWPLSEGSNVKKKFDEIFGQKRHVKLVEELKNKLKEIKQQNALHATELNHFEANREKSGELAEERDRVQQKLNINKQEVETIDSKISEMKGKLKDSLDKVQEVQSLEKKKDEYVTRLETVKRTKTQLEGQLNTNYPHSTEKLLQMLSTFERDYQEKRAKEHEYKLKLTDTVESYESAAQHLQSYNIDLAKLKVAQKNYEKLQSDNAEMLRVLLESFGQNCVVLLGSNVSMTGDCNPIHWVETQIDTARQRENTRAKESGREQKETQSKIDNLKKTINQAEGEIKVKKESRTKLKVEMDKLLVEIHQIKTSAANLSRIEQDKKAADEEYERFQSESRLEELCSTVDEKSKEMKIIADKQSLLSSELEILHLETKTRDQRERAEQDLQDKDNEIGTLLSKHKETIMFHLKGMPPAKGHGRTLYRYLEDRRAETKSQNSKLAKHQRTLAELESECKMAKRQLVESETKARATRNRIVDVCSNPAIYESEVERAELSYKQAKQSVSGCTNFQYLYNRWMNKLDETHTCPVCKTHLNDERTKFVVDSMAKKIEKAPQSLVEKKELERVAEQRFFALKSAANLYTELNDLEKTLIPGLTERVKNLSAQIEEENETIEDINDSLETLVYVESEARMMQTDLDYVDRLQAECGTLKDTISDLGSRLVSSYTKTLTEAIDEQGKYQEQYDALRHEVERLTDSKKRAENKKNALQQNCNTLKQQYLDLNFKLQGLKGMEDRRKEKALEITALSKRERSIEETIAPAQEELQTLETDLSRTQEMNEQTQKDISGIINRLSNEVGNARKLENQIAKERSGGGEELTQLQDRIAQCDSECSKLHSQKKQLDAQYQQVQRELNSSQVQKRDLEDCVQIRKLEQEMEGIDDKVEEVECRLTDKELVSARKHAGKLQAALEDLGQQKAGQEGRNRGFADQLRRLARELESDMFKDAALKHHHHLIKVTAGRKAQKDIDMYIMAYERALMRFHSDRMQEINKTLRDFWVSIYRGGDIDYIEIRTDDDMDKESSSKRKTCHYRVVMIKGGISVDMRSHSSAGQRVLAALLIRLSLAETFCDKCGIIALDEPTTNLDRENIESLAQSLSKFIKDRQAAGSFQLIVITHDEDFVSLLGRNEYIDHYFKVCKDDQQNSVIIKRSVAGLDNNQ